MDEIIVVSCGTCHNTVYGTVSDGEPVGFSWVPKHDAPQGRVAICDKCAGVETKPTKKSKASHRRRGRQPTNE